VRWAALFLASFALSLTTLGIDAFGTSDYGGDEPHYLLAAESLVSDGDVDVTNQRAERAWREWYPYELELHGRATNGRLNEPHGIGFPLMISAAYAIGGPKLVEILLAAIAAIAFVLAAALARRLVPEPWATGGVAAVALSAPAVAYGATIYPELTAGALLAGAAVLALRVRERPSLRSALLAALLVALLPWLGTKYLLPGLPILAAMMWWLTRRGRRLAAIFSAEVLAASLIAYVSVNDVLYGGLTPYSADIPGQTATDAAFPLGYAERLPRFVALWLDRGYGLLRWAPVVALAFVAVWLLWRSRRERMAQVVPEVRDREAAAALLLLVCGAQIAIAAFGAPTMYGFWFPGRHLMAALPCAAALAAWSLRHFPRTGGALGAISLLATVWLLVQLWTGSVDGWVAPDSQAPWGPLVDVLPLYGVGSAWADAVAAGVVAALVLVVAREARKSTGSSSAGD
jgi:hypothetical protein